MKITAKDIARDLGVSQATVSMVLRGKPGISEATRKQVLERAAAMGYSFERNASRQSGIIQLVVFKRHGRVVSDNPFMEILAQGVAAQAAELGYHLSISYFYGDKNCKEQLKSLSSLRSQGILLLATEMGNSNMELFRNLSIPIVMLDNYASSMNWDAVVIDNRLGVRAAVRHLIECGHTRIGYLHSNVDIRNFLERQSGYLSGCQLLPKDSARDSAKRIVCANITSSVFSDYGYRMMKDFLASERVLPSAFFADNDYIASGCYRALLEAGYQIPEDVSIIGFDDSPVSEIMEPQLTTMAVPKERMGAIAVTRLVERIKSPGIEKVRISIMPELVKRSSVLQLKASTNSD